MTGRVETAFQEFIAAVYPGETLGPVQLKECRNSFFAGVHWMQVKLPASLDIGEAPTDADLVIMNEVNDEIVYLISSLITTRGRG